MPINLQNPENVSSGWPAPEHLSAAPIGEVLKVKLQQQALMQKTLANAIKNMQTQRQDAAFAQALQNAGLTEGQDVSGLSAAQQARMVQLLADRTPDTQRDALIQAQIAHLNRLPSRGGGDGSAEPQTNWDEQGREWRLGPGGRWIPMKIAKPDAGPKLTPTEKGWAAPEIPGVSVDVNAPDDPGKFLPPDTPSMPGPPATPPLLQRPDAPPASDTAGGHAQDYGVKGVKMQAPDGSVKTVDPDDVDYYKSKGAVVIP